jgi:hypothetical protein
VSILSDVQIIALWIMEGGSISSAPAALAHAKAESSGSTTVTSANPDGGTNVGLYQLDTNGVGAGHTVAQLQDPYLNAQLTVHGSANGSNWASWPDQWQDYIADAQTATAAFTASAGSNLKAYAAKLLADVSGSQTAGGTTSGSASTTAGSSSATAGYSALGVGAVLSQASGLLHDVATVLDYVFGMFGRGQGWRLVFFLVAAAALLGSFKAFQGAGTAPSLKTPGAVPEVI